MSKGVKIVLVLLIILLVFGGCFLGWKYLNSQGSKEASVALNVNKKESWQDKGVVIPGQFADADVVALGNGQYRIYYASEPESGNLDVYSSISSDGINWKKEDGVRKSNAVFPDVINLPDNKWRMYFQNAGEIKSSISDDGLTFQDEPGTRISNSESGYNLDNVGAQSTTKLPDGTYIMVYRGMINEPYQTKEQIPNKTTQIYFYATSQDGLVFEKKGLAIDARNETLFGLADGADWSDWNGKLRVYFWSYAGVYYVIYDNGKFSEPTFAFSNNEDSKVKFSPNPPCDPTLVKIGNTWFMYYGQHTKGIYYATLQ